MAKLARVAGGLNRTSRFRLTHTNAFWTVTPKSDYLLSRHRTTSVYGKKLLMLLVTMERKQGKKN